MIVSVMFKTACGASQVKRMDDQYIYDVLALVVDSDARRRDYYVERDPLRYNSRRYGSPLGYDGPISDYRRGLQQERRFRRTGTWTDIWGQCGLVYEEMLD